MNQNCAAFKYVKNKFHKTRDAKIEEDVFVGHQIRELIQYVNFAAQLTEAEKAAWKFITNNFLGSHKAESYRDMGLIL